MNIIRKIVKETLLVPVRIIQGAVDAASTTMDAMEGKDKKR